MPLDDRIIRKTVHPDDPVYTIQMVCGNCGRQYPICPVERIGHCVCGEKDWRRDG